MIEYELVKEVERKIIQGQAVFLMALSAYLVVAYTVGAKLTSYQVSTMLGACQAVASLRVIDRSTPKNLSGEVFAGLLVISE